MSKSIHTKKLLFNRDLSWLSFNGRVLREGTKDNVPLLERINFLAIFSSNLDEFYRVRMPVITAINKINKKKNGIEELSGKKNVYKYAKRMIEEQMATFGHTLEKEIIPLLKENNIHILYNEPIPDEIVNQTKDYFYEKLASFLEITYPDEEEFFPSNNSLYFIFTSETNGKEKIGIINIPSNQVSRFFTVTTHNKTYIVFIDDIIRQNLPFIFSDSSITGIYPIKVTRDADLDLEDEFKGSLALKIEKQIKKRDFGIATRFLYPPHFPKSLLNWVSNYFNLKNSSIIKGGNYHNLKDFFSFPIDNKEWKYHPQPPIRKSINGKASSLLSAITKGDILINTPYESYNNVLRFFNEAALNQNVEEIYISMYRVANDSKILNALISAAKNGKKVTVFVELKARFDEENNIFWAKKLTQAGVHVLYSIPNLKVHAKIALIKNKENDKIKYLGLLSTGNLNEKTAGVYADHILLTANQNILKELKTVFNLLTKRRKKNSSYPAQFEYLLVAQYNLIDRFNDLIDYEISQANQGLPASIIVKVNNLEEKGMIYKLYEASQAGVKIQLIVRSICRLVPGVKGMSENITVSRIVDRYLEHSRVFIFHNSGNQQIYLGSADWMSRNLFNRIEVCFPIIDPVLKKELKDIIDIQLSDDTSAEFLSKDMEALAIQPSNGIRAQEQIYSYCLNKNNKALKNED